MKIFCYKRHHPSSRFEMIVANVGYESGLIWLLSITVVVMIPVMVIWLVWLWLAWSKTDLSQLEGEEWHYEYE